MIEVSTTAISFGELAVNDIPSYKHIRVRNADGNIVCVHLSSSSPSVKFQLENENASINVSNMNDRMAYNELFDCVNLIDSLTLDPGEEKGMIVLYRAEKSSYGHLLPQSQPVAVTGTVQFMSRSGGSPRGFPRSLSSADMGTEKDFKAGTDRFRVSPSGSSGTVRSESLSIPMYGSVYLSRLQVSPVELQATMAPNKTQCLDFTVTNISSRPIPFVIRSQTMSVKGLDLTLYEAERFEEPKLGHRLLLDSNAFINLSLMMRTTASSFTLQQYQSVLQCDNLRDPENTVLVNVCVNIVAESQGDLISLSDTTLNFGDVYRGTKTVEELGFLNADGREDVTVTLGPSYKRSANGEVFLAKDETTVDEVTVPTQKGMQYVKVSFKPVFTTEQLETERIKFDLEFTATSATSGRTQRVVVRCTANLFTSTIIVPQKTVNFGDCQVGESKRRTFYIENQSPLPGSVLVQLRSKIVSIEGRTAKQSLAGGREVVEEFTIGPSSKLPVLLKMSPQRVNPTYRKQLTIVNMTNPHEDKQIINIEANNMAPPEAKVHNELYTWDCRLPGGASQSVPLGAISSFPVLVPYSVKSKSTHPVVLNIKSTCQEIEVLYCPDTEKTQQLEAVATECRSYCAYGGDGDVNAIMHLSPERLEQRRRELVTLLSESNNVVSTLTLEPKSAITLFAVIIRSMNASDALTKEDGLLISIEGVDTPRFVRLSYRLCGTVFSLLGQKTRNFGEVNIGVKKKTMIPIVNHCSSVLFLKVEKSLSVTAGHIRMEHSERQSIFVTLRPFASREVEISFFPGIKGSFDEKVKLTNLLNPENRNTLTLKATVIKADTFDVSPDSWNFGSVELPSLEATPAVARVGARFMVANTSKTRRQIRVKLDTSSSMNNVNTVSTSSAAADPLTLWREMGSALFGFVSVDVQIQLSMELSGAGTGSSRKIEEQIEKFEQKLKIHERKKKFEKMEIVKKRIESLKRALLGEEVDLSAVANHADHGFSESEDESASHQNKGSQTTELMMQLLRDGVPLPTMNVGESVAITFRLTCTRLSDQAVPAIQTGTLNLLLFEAKDQEVNRIFPIDVTLSRPEDEPDTHTVLPAFGTGSVPASVAATPSSLISLVPDVSGRTVSSFMGHPSTVLRNTIVNDCTELTFLVKTSSSTAVVILEPRRCGGPASETLDARFKFFPRNGMVRADEALRIVAECTPRSVGPQKYFIPVKNLQNAADVRYLVVEMNPTEEEERVIAEPKQLVFEDIVTPCDPRRLESQLLLIRSRYPFPHSLLVRSNKPSQVLLFEDAQCSVPLRNPIQRTFMRETVRLYVRFSPSPKSTYHRARHIHAGVVVEAIVANGEGRYSTIGKAVVNVTVRVGSGVLLTPTTSVELGAVPMMQRSIHRTIEVINPSDSFRVQARIAPASSNVSVGTENSFSLRPQETRHFPVELLPPVPGLFREHVVIHNLTCRQEPVTVSFSFLRSDDAVTTQTPPSGSGDYVLPTAAVVRDEDGGFRLHEHTSTSLIIRNSTTKDLILASQSALPLVLSSKGSDRGYRAGIPQSNVDFPRGSPNSLTAGGGRVRAEAQHSQKMVWTLSGVPDLTEAQSQSLLKHDLVSLQAIVKVQVVQIVEERSLGYNLYPSKSRLPSVGQCVLLLPFTVPLAFSEGRAEPTLVNLGVVGQAKEEESEEDNGQEEARTEGSAAEGVDAGSRLGQRRHSRHVGGAEKRPHSSVRVKLFNLSQHLPLHLKVECPPIIRFSATRIVIPPGQTAEVEANLQLKEIRTQGAFRYEAFFVNELNSENDIAVAIVGQYYWKVFQLSTKTIEDVHETLTLPPLHVEGSSAIPVVLSEERLTVSATESDVELRVRVQSNPKLEGLVQLQLLHYDSTSSVEALQFRDETSEALATARGTEESTNTTTATTARGVDAGVAGGNPLGSSDTAAAGAAPNGTGSGGTAPATGGGTAGTAASVAGGGGPASANATGTGAGGRQGSGAATQASQGSSRRKPGPQAAAQQRSKTVRVRCTLLKNDLASLASLFSGFRKKTNAVEGFTFNKIPDLKKRRSTGMYSNMWIGTVTFSNRLTNDEDIAVFGQLDPFSTFTTQSKLSLGPSRLPSDTPTSSTLHNHLVFTGELKVTNICDSYTTELTLAVLISEQLTTLITVQVTGSEDTAREEENTLPKRAVGAAEAVDNSSFAEAAGAAGAAAAARAPALVTTSFTNESSTNKACDSQSGGSSPPEPAATAGLPPAKGASVASGGHRFRVAPKAVATLHVLVYSNNPHEMKSIQQSSLEQLVAMAIVDDNVTSSVSVVRLGVTPLQGEVDEAPLYLNALRTSDAAAAGAPATTGDRATTAATESNSAAAAGADGGPATAGTPSAAVSAIAATLPPHAGSAAADRATAPDSLESSTMLPHGANDGASVATDGSGGTAATAAATAAEEGSKPPPSAAQHKHAISLKHCSPVIDCPGAYSIAYSVPRGEAPQGDIAIRNNLQDRTVEYTASVTSQSPLSWILLPSNSGVLEAGETQTLQLNLLTSEVGSFVGYVAIHNNANPFEVVYLRLSAEVFVPSAGEGLFEVVASSGLRVASSDVRCVSLGHLYGSRVGRAYIALELINRSTVPLEFPVSVVKPFRVEVKSVTDSASLEGLLQRRRGHHNPHQLRHSSNGTGKSDGRHSPPPPAPSQGEETSVAVADTAVHELGLSPPLPLPSAYPSSSSAPVFEGKLIACHIHGVPTQSSQKYIVVDPKSRVRVTFVLSCMELRVPAGCGVFGEADVVFKCKQARDAVFTFCVRFEAYQPTFRVRPEVEIDSNEGFVRIPVHNTIASAQTFIFRSQSPVLCVVAGTGKDADDEVALAAAAMGANRATAPASFAEIEVRGEGTGYFAVKIDVLRAAALLNFDNDDGELHPALCEHAFILNGHNPRERVRMQFRQGLKKGSTSGIDVAGLGPSDQQQQQQQRVAQMPSIIVPSNSPAPVIGSGMLSTTVAKPVKVGGQHIGEHFVMRFAQQFTSTMSFYEERLMATLAHYGARRDGEGGGVGVAGSEGDSDDDSSSTSDESVMGAAAAGAEAVLDVPPTPFSGAKLTDDGIDNFFAESNPPTVHSSPRRGSGSDGVVSSSSTMRGQVPAELARQPHVTSVAKEERKHGLPSAAWRSLRALLLDLTWLVDELVFYSILLRNSRLIQGYCVFVTAAVCNHPVVKTWRQYKTDLPPEFNIFAEYLEMLDYLPCPMPS